MSLSSYAADSVSNVPGDISTVPTTPDRSRSGSPGLDDSNDEADKSSEKVSPMMDRDTTHRVPAKAIRSICVVGAGYVGGPTAAIVAYKNPHVKVTVVDRDDRRIRRWNSRHLPIYEPGLSEIVRIARDGLHGPDDKKPVEAQDTSDLGARSPNLFFSTDVSQCIQDSDVVFIAVNTPTKMRGTGKGSATDMTSFEAVAAEVVRHAKNNTIIVEKSTVPCRTAQMIQEMISLQRPGEQFEILSNPEFLAAGTAVQDLLHPDRIIIGSAPTPEGRAAAESLAGVYSSWIDRSRILTTNVWSSELAKLVANSMLAQRLSSINSISAICEATGAEVNEVSAAIGMDTRLGKSFLRAGIGFGGSCFKKDIASLAYIAESLGLDEVAHYWRQVNVMNEYQRDRFAARVIRHLNSTLVTKKICILGYAFKPNTSDTREAPALEIIKTLLDENPREIAIFDPCCNRLVIENEIRALQPYGSPVLSEDGGCVKVYSDVYEACADSNAVLIVTDFPEFKNSPVIASPPTLQAKVTQKPQKATPSNTSSPLRVLSHERFKAEPDCSADCPDCQSGITYGESNLGVDKDVPKQQVNWKKIAGEMRSPKWLFDGRCIINIPEMTKLGIRVESIGSAGLAV
ncbi:UDP-glucose 6-dehydrogenase [Penicillium maclennaniae]|uniref:UDP-glucose 6-dehydrogenase n=1 Tax=Penicillium maclennaniae TaxID=1343394 RepID=UPI0025411820|nr:UDP-glucose 6-dehydrogenase [Penicillium maclennaniae]KAJ5661459.1 UDP-glucose 6-dehydrogenase [Penicillium maclennaniae]